MASYLLLRSNKESGPYSLDELLELGLKPYDLVWVKGKSAAWRYPSEIDELKAMAPAVEEQPFDRFYKRPVEEKAPPLQKATDNPISPEHEKYIPKKSVFVTLPGKSDTGRQAAPVPKESNTQPPQPQPVKETIQVTENPVAAQLKYSQPLDEIKEMYVKTLHERKQKIRRKGFWMQSLKKVAAVLLLIAVGLVAGFVIKSKGTAKSSLISQAQPLQQAATTTDLSVINSHDTSVIPMLEESKPIPPPSGGYVNEEVQRAEPAAIPKELTLSNVEKKETSSNRRNEDAVSIKEAPLNANPPGVETDPATGARNRRTRSDNNIVVSSPAVIAEKKSFRSDDKLNNLVSVESNDYKRVAFGGIRNLELTVTNDSKYTLDNVIVELQYLKPSEQPLRTENVEFKSVGPKATATVRIPDTNRGIKVSYRIIHVKSREMDEIASGN